MLHRVFLEGFWSRNLDKVLTLPKRDTEKSSRNIHILPPYFLCNHQMTVPTTQNSSDIPRKPPPIQSFFQYFTRHSPFSHHSAEQIQPPRYQYFETSTHLVILVQENTTHRDHRRHSLCFNGPSRFDGILPPQITAYSETLPPLSNPCHRHRPRLIMLLVPAIPPEIYHPSTADRRKRAEFKAQGQSMGKIRRTLGQRIRVQQRSSLHLSGNTVCTL